MTQNVEPEDQRKSTALSLLSLLRTIKISQLSTVAIASSVGLVVVWSVAVQGSMDSNSSGKNTPETNNSTTIELENIEQQREHDSITVPDGGLESAPSQPSTTKSDDITVGADITAEANSNGATVTVDGETSRAPAGSNLQESYYSVTPNGSVDIDINIKAESLEENGSGGQSSSLRYRSDVDIRSHSSQESQEGGSMRSSR